jgi:hypothetical protein
MPTNDDDAYEVIEFPAAGETYGPGIDGRGEEYGVYRYSTYPEWSSNAGRTRRSFLGSYTSEALAKKNHPDAETGAGCGYVEYVEPVNPPADFDPTYAGESWDGD